MNIESIESNDHPEHERRGSSRGHDQAHDDQAHDHVDPDIEQNDVEWLRTRAFSAGCQDVVTACDQALAALTLPRGHHRDQAMRGFSEGWTRWQASDVSLESDAHHSDITLAQICDLQRYAQRAGDHHAYRICALAILPICLMRAPEAAELSATDHCAWAWNARAARLRGVGVQPIYVPRGSGRVRPRINP